MKRLLVMGSGQLGLMMAAEAARIGVAVDRLDMATGEIIPGTSDRRLTFSTDELLSHYELISAEVEHLPDTELVKALVASPKFQNKPAFDILPDRATQKELLDELNIATSPWMLLTAADDIDTAHQQLGEKLIVKATRGGYDGRGQWRLSQGEKQDLPDAMFGKVIAEKRINFHGEVSLVGGRNAKGETHFLPLVENVHDAGILRYTIARESVKESWQAEAENMLTKLMERLDYTGVLAMELFISDEGLLVNELAPRVHNSGHWSQLGSVHNQFALHLRGLVNLPLPPEHYHKPTIMINLIGCELNHEWLAIPGVQCHWYGKDVRPGRKVGHLNLDCSDASKLDTKVKRLLPCLDDTHRDVLTRAIERYRQQ